MTVSRGDEENFFNFFANKTRASVDFRVLLGSSKSTLDMDSIYVTAALKQKNFSLRSS